MASGALSAFGTLLKRGDGGGSETFVSLSEVRDLHGPGGALGLHETTTHASPGARREFVAGLLDAGEVTLQLNYIPTNSGHIALRNDWRNRIKRNFQIVFPGAIATMSFSAYISNFEEDMPVDGPLTADVTLTVTGDTILT